MIIDSLIWTRMRATTALDGGALSLHRTRGGRRLLAHGDTLHLFSAEEWADASDHYDRLAGLGKYAAASARAA